MSNELITVEQQAVLSERFDIISGQIDEKIALANGMEISDDNYKDAKKIRAGMNKEAKVYADEFKEVEETVLAPWNRCKAAYQEKVRDKYREIDSVLRDKIGEIEGGLKAEKEQEIVSFFEEHRKANDLDFVTYGSLRIKVGLSDSLTSLKKQVSASVEQIAKDRDVIIGMEDGAEVMTEYQNNGYSLTDAIARVKDRHERIRLQQEAQEKQKAAAAEKKAHEDEIKQQLEDEAPSAPVEIEEPELAKEKGYSATFKVTGTIEQLTALSHYLKDNNFCYEQIKEDK